MCHSSWAEEGQDGCPRGGGRRMKAKTNVTEMNVPETDVPEAEEGGGRPRRMSLCIEIDVPETEVFFFFFLLLKKTIM